VTVELAGATASGDERQRPPLIGGSSYVLRHVRGAVFSLLFVTVLNFFLFRVLDGDPVRSQGRARRLSPEQTEQLRKTLGLDQPLAQQFLTYLKNTFTGELGVSYQTGQSVSSLLVGHLWPTLLIVGTASVLAALIGVVMGIKSAWNNGGRFDRWSTYSNLALYSAPEWWLGLLLMAALAVGFGPLPGIFPTGGLHSPDVDPMTVGGVIDTIWHMVLPVTTMTLVLLAQFSLIMRSSLIGEMGEDYLRTARAKGLRDALVRRHHAVPNALLPATTVIALRFGFVVSGSITIETVFSIQGFGLLTRQAIDNIDRPVLQGLFLSFSAAVIAANLIANILYGLLDPRTRK
jgi:peptide/nickel transport system permease protein